MLDEDQWGTIPLCSAEQPALLDEFITQIDKLTSWNLANHQHYATIYYDRMIQNLTTLCSHHFCFPDKVCMLQTIALKTWKIISNYFLIYHLSLIATQTLFPCMVQGKDRDRLEVTGSLPVHFYFNIMWRVSRMLNDESRQKNNYHKTYIVIIRRYMTILKWLAYHWLKWNHL